ncbi:histidinol dehydrogenase [Helicobacter aurati]|uniref:Histidinol dehydrogenase n=1 Tax=Helicobacter aurati TaxID=137778 RepID=A0A3D8J6C1_9HELI|nr:histidinol dehydrogenase [Helicobacter aurati]RDU72745.1 histidinol dehydrogenase [Helicobacter aurati]
MIKLLDTTNPTFAQDFNTILLRAKSDIDHLIPEVLATLQDIRQRGETALTESVKKYDKWNPTCLKDLRVDRNLAEDAYKKLDSHLRKSLQTAFERIYEFHILTKPKGFIHHDKFGNLLGMQVLPVSRAGIYVPGGKAFYPSSLLMNAIPAKVAGVPEIIMTTPTPNNQISETLLASIHLCGITECYKIGGVGAIGLLAYGLQDNDGTTIFSKVDCISGPGNIFVATAKKLVFGEVNIDMIAGPSEIGIIADSSANPDFIAIDMLSQAEHDEMASSLLITNDARLAREVARKIEEKLVNLCRKQIATTSITHRGAIIVAQDLEEAASLMNQIAPEHLEIITQNPYTLLPLIKAAGAIFLGHYTPEAIGDYLAGPNHTLPTGGSARFFSPLGVQHFCTNSSLISFSKSGLENLAADCAALAQQEGLEAHKLSVLARLNNASC